VANGWQDGLVVNHDVVCFSMGYSCFVRLNCLLFFDYCERPGCQSRPAVIPL